MISVFYLAVQDQSRERYEELVKIFPHAQFVSAPTYQEAMVKAASKLLTTDYFFVVCDIHYIKHSITLISNKLERVMMEPGALNERKDVLSYPSQAWPATWNMIQKIQMSTDIIFLSYDELAADAFHANLAARFGDRVKRVHGVKGIDRAHKKAACVSTTNWFYVVDADNIIEQDFDFSFYPDYGRDEDKFVHIWMARNGLIPQLTYGYGGVKLFHKRFLENAQFSGLDFSTKVAPVQYHDSVASTTKFNTDPWRTWRATFRESVKLINFGGEEGAARLALWKHADLKAPYASWAIDAIEWAENISKSHSVEDLHETINDFDHLKMLFQQIYRYGEIEDLEKA